MRGAKSNQIETILLKGRLKQLQKQFDDKMKECNLQVANRIREVMGGFNEDHLTVNERKQTGENLFLFDVNGVVKFYDNVAQLKTENFAKNPPVNLNAIRYEYKLNIFEIINKTNSELNLPIKFEIKLIKNGTDVDVEIIPNAEFFPEYKNIKALTALTIKVDALNSIDNQIKELRENTTELTDEQEKSLKGLQEQRGELINEVLNEYKLIFSNDASMDNIQADKQNFEATAELINSKLKELRQNIEAKKKDIADKARKLIKELDDNFNYMTADLDNIKNITMKYNKYAINSNITILTTLMVSAATVSIISTTCLYFNLEDRDLGFALTVLIAILSVLSVAIPGVILSKPQRSMYQLCDVDENGKLVIKQDELQKIQSVLKEGPETNLIPEEKWQNNELYTPSTKPQSVQSDESVPQIKVQPLEKSLGNVERLEKELGQLLTLAEQALTPEVQKQKGF